MSRKIRNPQNIDKWLEGLDLYRKSIAYDETCLFRAVSEQLFECQIYHERVRTECIAFAKNHFDQFNHFVPNEELWMEHLLKLEKHMLVCGDLELQLISRTYNRDILLAVPKEQEIVDITKRDFPTTPLMLCLVDDDHYDAVYKKEQINDAGFCQSIVYKSLYEQVFEIPNVDQIANAMLFNKVAVISKDKHEEKHGEEELVIKDNLDNAIIAPFPYKVAKALHPDIYRNIEYDSWNNMRKGRLANWYKGDDKLTIGTKCVLNDEKTGKPMECYIQKLDKEEDKCMVYITKLAELKWVCYLDLAPEPNAKPWPLPHRFNKSFETTPTTKLAPMEKIKSARRKNSNFQQQSASVGDLPSIEADVRNYTGVTLQKLDIRNNNSEPSRETHEANSSESLTAPSTTQFSERCQWEPSYAYYPQTPDSQDSAPYGEYKPMMASAPVTPNVVPYYDTSYPFYFNYHIPHYSPYPLTPLTPLTNSSVAQNAPEHVGELLEPPPNYLVNPCGSPHDVQQNLTPQNFAYVQQPMDLSPQVLNYPPGSSVIYTSIPQGNMTMVVPTSPTVVYTPTNPIPAHMSYMTTNFHNGDSSVPLYQPTNEHGFIFHPRESAVEQ
ncbi:hypothetical protein HUJ04_011717 [Dendroctonus ponderosae]|nr:hypothetical protein HUJ04_011717 [Dendroctonus ponderosae]KAH1028865.1 hypothetical protein HUJ05_002186 [Dendroctonus ponderosae]